MKRKNWGDLRPWPTVAWMLAPSRRFTVPVALERVASGRDDRGQSGAHGGPGPTM
jgi:hypothetical protein